MPSKTSGRRENADGRLYGVSPSERFWSKVQRNSEDECWLWTAAIKQGTGYGAFQVNGRSVLAHRFAYADAFGPIPEGMQIDHLCRVRACVNPVHLEAVTPRENTRRSEGNATKTHCLRGHLFDVPNTIHSNGRRVCRTCRNARNRIRYSKNKT